MLLKEYRKIGVLVCFLFVLFTGYAQEYTVRGGSTGTPLLAEDNTKHRIQVYMVYGMENVEISYSSSSTSHQWFRYKTKWSEREAVSSVQNGTTSTIRGIEPGYGYYVDDAGAMSRFIWLIDYSQYTFTINNMRVAGNDPCLAVSLAGDANIETIRYATPDGTQTILDRVFDVSYRSMAQQDGNKFYTEIDVVEEIKGNPLGVSLKELPYCDTQFRLSGDHFARHFGMEKSITTDTYSAVAVVVMADTTIQVNNAPSIESGVGLSLPITVRFTAYANEPVAAQYIWWIWDRANEAGRDDPMFRFPGKELEYTFDRDGDYAAQLEVTNFNSTCSYTSEEISVQIDESDIKIPNAFTPGTSPGINDEFKIAYKSLKDFKAWIFNRWGQQLFHWKDPAQGWDGKFKGKYVAPGAYYYVIEYTDSKGKKRVRKGDINVIRPKTINDNIR